MNRRGLLKLMAGLSLATPLLNGFTAAPQSTSLKATPKGVKSIFYDSNLCIGCRLCQRACREKWGLKTELAAFYPSSSPRLSSNTWVTIIAKPSSSGGFLFARRSCQHCDEPACASVCPARAITKHENGPVVIDEKRCFGCQYCIVACPFRVPKLDPELKVARKCSMCHDLVAKGQPPACVQVCPTKALKFGDKEEIAALAMERAKKTGGYLYGLREAAGTNVLLLLKAPSLELGLPEVSTSSYTSPAVLGEVLTVRGGLGLFGLAVLAFLGFVLWRREVIGREKVKEIPR